MRWEAAKRFFFLEMGAARQTLNTWRRSWWEDLTASGVLCPQLL